MSIHYSFYYSIQSTIDSHKGQTTLTILTLSHPSFRLSQQCQTDTVAVWKTHTGFRFIAAAHFVILFAIVVYIDGFIANHAADIKDQCIHHRSRLITKEIDNYIDAAALFILSFSHFVAIIACLHNSLLWLSVCCYKLMFLLTAFMTIAQGMSGYIENCFNIFTLFCVAHLGMAIGLFYLHILFIYTHRGTTFYQWIPLKIGEIYRSLTHKKMHPRDHLIGNIAGVEYVTRKKHEKIPLLEEDQEDTLAAWKTHTGFRFAAAIHFLMLFGIIIYVDGFIHDNVVNLNDECIYDRSRLLTIEMDKSIVAIGIFILAFGHFVAIMACFHNDLLWVGVCCYKLMFLLTISMTLAQGMSGYVQKCFNNFSLFCVAHLGMIFGLFYLHILFIYTHRGTTFYQWIPLKIGEIYRSLTHKKMYPKDHLIGNIAGVEYVTRKHEKIPLLEEDQEVFEKLIKESSAKG